MCANVQGGQYLKVWYQIDHKIEGLFLYNISSINFHLLSVEIVHLSADTVDGTWVISFTVLEIKPSLVMNLAVCRNRHVLLEDESRSFEAVSYIDIENSKRSIFFFSSVKAAALSNFFFK